MQRKAYTVYVCVCVRLQEVYAAPLRFLSDTMYDDPWSRHLMSILAPLQYIKVPVTFKHSCYNIHMLWQSVLVELCQEAVFFCVFLKTENLWWCCFFFLIVLTLCVSGVVYQNAGSGTSLLLQTGACSLYQRHSDLVHPHRNLSLLGEILICQYTLITLLDSFWTRKSVQNLCNSSDKGEVVIERMQTFLTIRNLTTTFQQFGHRFDQTVNI